MKKRASFLHAAKGPAGVVQVIEPDLHRRDGPLQIVVLVRFPRNFVGVDGVIVRSVFPPGVTPSSQYSDKAPPMGDLSFLSLISKTNHITKAKARQDVSQPLHV